jgi:phage shock protein A
MREREKKMQEAKEAIRAHDRAKWQAKIADTLEQFEVAGVDATHDEMVQRVNEQSARNEARMEMALDSIDTESMQIEEDAQEIQAAELVKQFKLEMGMSEPPAPVAAPTPRIQIPEADESAGGGGGTRDRERTE